MDKSNKVIKQHNKVAWEKGETKQHYKLIKSKHGFLNVALGVTFASMGILFLGIGISANTTQS